MKRLNSSTPGLRRSLAGLAAAIAFAGLGQGQAQTAPNTYCTAVFSVGPYSSDNGQIQVYSPDSNSLMTISTRTVARPNAAAINGNNGWLYYADQSTLQMYVYKPDTDEIVKIGYALRDEGGSLIGASFDPTSQNYYVYFSSGRIAQYSVSGTSMSYVGSRNVTSSSGSNAFRNGTNGDIVINSSGQAYIIGEDGNGKSMVGTINLNTGVVTNLKSLYYGGSSQTGMNGLAFDPTDNTYYVSDQDSMYLLNVSTGAMTLVTSQNRSYDLASCAGSKPNPPTISKTFSPTSVALPSSGPSTSRLTITLNNSNSSAIYLTSDLVDQLPGTPGVMKIAGTPNLGGTCPNLSTYVVATAGSTTLTVKSGERIPSGGCTISMDVTAPVAGTYTNSIPATALKTTAGSNAAGTTASLSVISGTTPPPTTTCTNLYALVITKTDYDAYGNPVMYYGGKIQRLDETTNTLTGGTITLFSGATSATLAVSPDGSKFYTADDSDYLWIYNTSTASWTRAGYFSGVADRLVRMTVTPGGTGYAMDSSGNFWSFTPSGGTQYLGKVKSSSTTTPNFYQNGDFFATADGKLYMLSAQTGGTVNLWYVNPATLTAEFLGNMTDASRNVQYNGLAATPNGVYAANSAGRLGNVDPINVTITPVGTTTTGSTDLASCYYPTYAPKIGAVKSVKKVAGSTGSDVRPGDTLEYTITVRNSGTLPAGGVTFKDALPAGTTYVADSARVNGFTTTTLNGTTINLGGSNYPFTSSVGICSASTTACTDQVMKVDTTPSTIDNEAVITFRVTVNEGTTSIRNVGIINYNDGNTPPTDIPTNPVDTPVVPWPQLTITKTSNATGGTWTVGQTGATYTLTVKNTGTVPTSGTITVKDLLPGGITLSSSFTAPSGWTCSTSGQLLTCTTTNVLTAGASVNITVPVNVTGTTLGTLTNKAAVGGGSDPNPIPDPATCTPGTGNPQNQCASVPVNVVGAPTLNVTKTVKKVAGSTSTDVYPGDTLEYTITVRNTGSADATGVTVVDALPAGTTYVAESARVNGFTSTTLNGTTINLGGSTYPFASGVGICSTGTTACTTQTVKVDTTPTTLDNEAVITFQVKVVDPFTLTPSQVSNQAIVKYPGGLDTPSDNPTTPTPGDPTVTPVIKPAKLNVGKTVQNITTGTTPGTTGSGKPGDVLEYCIVTTNTGSANATKITFGDTVPSNTTFQLGGYGAGKDIHVTTSTGADLYYTAVPDTDAGALLNNRVTVSEPTFVLQPQQSFTVCFRTTIK